MIELIEVVNEAGYALDAATLQQAVAQVLRQESAAAEAGLTIVMTDNDSVAALNRQYRGIDAPTDVLSFPAEIPALDDSAAYLGDLVIAYPYAAAQATREGQDLMQSLSLLVVHGTLHLLGYDHDTAANQQAMWAAQDRALAALGLPLSLVPSADYDG